MHRFAHVAAALCALALVTGCRTPGPEPAKDADDVMVSIQEADRAFLYSRVNAQRLLELPSPKGAPAPAPIYAYNADTRELRALPSTEMTRLPAGENALIAVSVEKHSATVNLWNYIEKDVEQLTLRLDGLCARPASVPEGVEGEAFDVVFAAKEPAVFPLCRDKDYEVFKARLLCEPDCNRASLVRFEQLTFNDEDDTEPSFSPDGRWIVFTTRRLGPQNVALMDANGEFVRLLTQDTDHDSSLPAVLPNNEECLYVSAPGGVREFYICGLDGRGRRRASGDDLKKMLFSWDDDTRHAYLLTDAFAQNQDLRLLLDLPRRFDVADTLLLAEWNSPLLREYREMILAARAEREHNSLSRRTKLSAAVVSENVFTMSIPLFQGSLNKAVAQRDMWQEIVYSQTYLKRYSELAYAVALDYVEYSQRTAEAAVLQRVLDLHRKRRFLWEARVAEGKELPAKLTEADGYIHETEADITTALSKADAARARICAAMGLADMKDIEFHPMPMHWRGPPAEVPPLEELQALAQVDHPDLGRLKFLELRAAAIRDMGAPEMRDRTTLDLSLGGGSLFGTAADSAMAVTLRHTLPLHALGLQKSHREQWTHEMLSYRAQREQMRLDINASLQESFSALERTKSHLREVDDWQRVTQEKLRVARIYAAQQAVSPRQPHDVNDQIEAETADLAQQIVQIEARGEYLRHLAQYYERAGLARRLMHVLARRPVSPKARTRSVWLWRSLEVALDPHKRNEFLRVCREQGVTRVYCFVSHTQNVAYLERHHWEFGHLLDLCRQNGIEVYALVGSPQWVEDAARAEISSTVRAVVAFNSGARPDQGTFAGIKLDVEPHALPAWADYVRRANLTRAYLETIGHVRGLMGRDGAGLRLAADVPYTYLDVRVPDDAEKRLFDAVCERVDEVTVMAYLDSADRIIEKVMPLLEAADANGTPVEIGVELSPGQPAGISFSGRPLEDLVVALNQVYRRCLAHESFAGFAMHDYSSLLQMIEMSNGHQVPTH